MDAGASMLSGSRQKSIYNTVVTHERSAIVKNHTSMFSRYPSNSRVLTTARERRGF